MEFFRLIKTRLGEAKRVILAQLKGIGTDSDLEDSEPVDDAEIVFPLGLVSRPYPTSETEALVIRDGDEIVCLGVLDKGRSVIDLEIGETRLYGANTETSFLSILSDGEVNLEATDNQPLSAHSGTSGMYLDGTGNVEINKFGESKTIKFHHGDLGVARLEDEVSGGKFYQKWETVGGVINRTTLHYVDKENTDYTILELNFTLSGAYAYPGDGQSDDFPILEQISTASSEVFSA